MSPLKPIRVLLSRIQTTARKPIDKFESHTESVKIRLGFFFQLPMPCRVINGLTPADSKIRSPKHDFVLEITKKLVNRRLDVPHAKLRVYSVALRCIMRTFLTKRIQPNHRRPNRMGPVRRRQSKLRNTFRGIDLAPSAHKTPSRITVRNQASGDPEAIK